MKTKIFSCFAGEEKVRWTFLSRVLAACLVTSTVMTAVPTWASKPVEGILEAEIGTSENADVDFYAEHENMTLNTGCSCTPVSISTGLDEYEYWILEPGYSIGQYTNINLYVKCSTHGWYTVKITDAMCSYYQTDWLNQKLPITVTYMGKQVVMPVVYQYPLDNYSDIGGNEWFFGSAESVYQKLYMLGLTPTAWGPYDSLSRAQFATILYRMMDSPEYTTTKSFKDVPAGSWFEDPVLWAAENSIVTGYQDGNFGPADLITRDQMAVMMYRLAKACDLDVSQKVDLSGYLDSAYIPEYANEALAWTAAAGIITGKDNATRLAPLENTARAECAAIVSRFEEWAASR